MKAIFIAAGEGSRMGKLTHNVPKPLVKINGKSILERQLSLFQNKSIECIVITGPFSDKFKFKNVKYVIDKKFKDHDQMGSLMCAKNEIVGDVIILFADIIFEKSILDEILESKSDIQIAVDMNSEKTYSERTVNSFDEADKVGFENDKIMKIFKTKKEEYGKYQVGEFIGLMKLSENGSKQFVDCYDKISRDHKGKFHDAISLDYAKLVDFLQELLDNKITIKGNKIEGKWCEIDTEQDLNIAKRIFSD